MLAKPVGLSGPRAGARAPRGRGYGSRSSASMRASHQSGVSGIGPTRDAPLRPSTRGLCQLPARSRSVATRAASAQAQEGHVIVRFEVTVVPNEEGVVVAEDVKVTGGDLWLGDWDPFRGAPMQKVGDSTFRVEVQLPLNRKVEYKYLYTTSDQEVAWQQGFNKVIHTGQGHHVITLEDGWVGFETPHPVGKKKSKKDRKHEHEDHHHHHEEHHVGGNGHGGLPEPDLSGLVGPEGDKSPPQWALDAVWYQIYPLGFLDAPMHGGDPNAHAGDPPRLARLHSYFDHLQSLGVGAVLFNPLFFSDSHGYDTIDYYRIDPRLGSLDDFKALVDACHDRGIRVVLDGVFNHTSRNHVAFKELLERRGGGGGHYDGWYITQGHGVMDHGDGFAYKGWEGHGHLPELNIEGNEAAKEYIHDIARFWLGHIGVDGWRLDVAYEISPAFWQEFRNVCLEAKPDAILIGEIIHGDYRERVNGRCLHSCTNYQLYKAIWSSIMDKNYFELVHCWERCEDHNPGLTLLNFVGNHDVKRIASILGVGDPLGRGVARYKLAMAFMLLCNGMPCIYYGDEAGMQGEAGGPEVGYDAPLRRPMVQPWNGEGNGPGEWPAGGADTYRITKALCHIRRRHSGPDAALNPHNRMVIISNSNQWLAFGRGGLGKDSVIVLLNCGERSVEVELNVSAKGLGEAGHTWRDCWMENHGEHFTVGPNGRMRADIPAMGVRILEAVY
ncbi:unnamed protein product [Pedinophyceae sp. YPF-701]|nr:unnamed protein product [Pedinophyceae sp. YPF-701]